MKLSWREEGEMGKIIVLCVLRFPGILFALCIFSLNFIHHSLLHKLQIFVKECWQSDTLYEKSSLIWNFSKRYHNSELNFPNPDLEFLDPSLSISEKALQTMFSFLSVSWSRSPRRNSSPKFDPHDERNFYYFS